MIDGAQIACAPFRQGWIWTGTVYSHEKSHPLKWGLLAEGKAPSKAGPARYFQIPRSDNCGDIIRDPASSRERTCRSEQASSAAIVV
jgi:hypothetical protein